MVVVGLAEAPGWPTPAASLLALLPTLQTEAELIVVLLHAPGDPTPIAALPGVDVLIHAAHHDYTYAPRVVGGAVVVKSRFETRRIGELRLHVADGRVTRALDRHIDLDAGVPAHPDLIGLEREALAFGEVRPGG